jgi:DNA-binding GntR family transcriptional regulator
MTPIEKGHIQELLKEEQTAAQSGDIDAFATANRRLHTAIVAGAHNAVLEEAVSGYRIRTAPFRKAQLDLPHRLDETAADDARVVALILQGDGAGAAAALKAHLETTGYYASKFTAKTTQTPIKAKRRKQ